jgi:hypothetical protein
MTRAHTSPALELVLEERRRQDELHGPAHLRRIPSGTWLAVLLEETGEAARALLESGGPMVGSRGSFDVARRGAGVEGFDLVAELVQVAAVAVAWLEAIGAEAAERCSWPELERNGFHVLVRDDEERAA